MPALRREVYAYNDSLRVGRAYVHEEKTQMPQMRQKKLLQKKIKQIGIRQITIYLT